MTVISVKHTHLLVLSYRTLRQILFCFVFQGGSTQLGCVCVCGGGGCVYRGSSLHIMYSMTMPLLLQGTCWVCQSSASPHSTKICKSEMFKLPRNTVYMHPFHHWVQSPLYIAECEMSQAVSSAHGAGVVPVFFIHSLPSTMLPSMAIASISTLAPCHKQPHGRCVTLHILTEIPHVCAHTPAHTYLHTHIFTHTRLQI